jgi:hypothetical protein
LAAAECIRGKPEDDLHTGGLWQPSSAQKTGAPREELGAELGLAKEATHAASCSGSSTDILCWIVK